MIRATPRYGLAFFLPMLVIWPVGLALVGLALVGLALVGPALGQVAPNRNLENRLSGFVQVDETSSDVNAKLERLERYLEAKRWAEAVELAQQVMEEDGGRLKLVESGKLFQHYIPVSQFCSGLLSTQAADFPELLTRYRLRTDPLAQRIYDSAVATRDEAALQRIVDRYFLSSVTDDALLLLGDWALEAGQFARARNCWERLASTTRDAQGQPAWLALSLSKDPQPDWSKWPRPTGSFVPGWYYPDPALAPAEVWSRLIWASLVERRFERAKHELAGLKQFYPKASGRLGGRTVELASELEKYLQFVSAADSTRTPDSTVENRVGEPRDWRTFAGNMQRNGRASPGTELLGRPAWTIVLPSVNVDTPPPRLAESRQLLVHFPIVVGQTVFIHQEGALRALDLRSGRSRFGALNVGDENDPSTIGTMTRLPDRTTGQGTLGYDRFTASADESRLVLRSGLRVTYENADSLASMPSELRGNLVVLDLKREGRLVDGFPRIPTRAEWTFDGVPLIEGTRLYVAMRQVNDVRPRLSVACFEIPGSRMLWRQFVSSAQTVGGGQWGEITHSLLTLSGDQLIVNTNLGAIAALRKRDGQVRWLVRYPRADYPVSDPDRTDDHFQRDLVPAVVANGLAYAMPSDARRLFALDTATGWLQWASVRDAATDAKFLLGVGNGSLIVSGDSLYWFDALTGKKLTQFPTPYKHALGFARAEPRGFGRGVLVGDRVLWTSRDTLFAFHQGRFDRQNGVATPMFAQAPVSLLNRGASGGNLVAVKDMLLIAGPDTLFAFRRSD